MALSCLIYRRGYPEWENRKNLMKNKTNIEILFREHYSQLHQLAIMLLHDYDLARDIVHDVFVMVITAEKGDNVTYVYLMNAVRNRCFYIRNATVTVYELGR